MIRLRRARHPRLRALATIGPILLFAFVPRPSAAIDRTQEAPPLSDSPGPGGVYGAGALERRQSTSVTTYLLYPNACNQRNDPGTYGAWAPMTTIVADSLDTYSPLTQDHGYGIEDLSLQERLWHVTDGSDAMDGAPVVLSGSRSLWCGKYDPSWVVKSGYPNLTFQLLYLDTDVTALGGGTSRIDHGDLTYDLAWQADINTEFNYDFLYLIGGGDGATDRDPIGNDRTRLDKIRNEGSDGNAELLATMTGAQNSNQTLSYTGAGVFVEGDFSGESVTNWSLSDIPADHRGLYFLLASDYLYSSEDGLWPAGHGVILDNVVETDTRGSVSLYTDQTAAGGTDPSGGAILVSVNGSYAISARVGPGIGGVWSIQTGNTLPTSDICRPQKQLSADHMFLGADTISHLTQLGTYAGVSTCTFPLPTGVATVRALWTEYVDLPRQGGFVQYTEFRVFHGGSWSDWIPTASGRGLTVGSLQAWTEDEADLTEAAGADSVQVRFLLRCAADLSVDGINCQPATYGLMYDNIRLEVTTGVPAPAFRVFVGSIAQSTFVDGTDATSVGCSAQQIAAGACWPGIRGSNVTAAFGPIHDNLNSPLGDSLVVGCASGVRPRGMGINWQYGFDKSVLGGTRIRRLNGAYNAAYGTPAWIYRLFDPATKTWSPWDSSALDANSAQLSSTDTVVVYSDYRFNWPPRDKYYVNQGSPDIGPSADADLPGVGGGWSLEGHTKYSQVRFLPKGTRLQYYFKAVDVNGGVSYRFSADWPGLEVESLPVLPAGSIQAPDIIEFDVLPRAYPPGAGGTLAAGRTDAKVLNLDGAYSVWSNGYDPVTQALRAMGVRADRYRLLQGLGEGNNVGGHELPGDWPVRLGSFFPNGTEYGIVDSLAAHYNIIIQSSHLRDWTVFEEQDAAVVSAWWNTDTGVNGGDRCILGTGDALFSALLNGSKALPQFSNQVALAQNVFGVASCIDAWTGASTTLYPTIDDRFAGGGPGLASPGTFTYPVDGGCPDPNRFDGLTKVGSPDAQNAVFYPGGVPEVAGIAYSTEKDAGGSTDNDRSKALAYGFSIQFIRASGIPPSASNYVRSGVQNRMRVLYKFLTSCRKTTGGTTPCWPCPSNAAEMISNWATASGFQTGTYGALFPIQDFTTATGVPEEGPGVPGFVNSLSQNRPNPFNPETVVPYSLAAEGRVTIRIFDVAGRLVRTLVDGRQTAGPHVARWNGKADRGRPLASGIYFYTIRYPDGSASSRKMTILR
jgi:hypothetical protein